MPDSVHTPGKPSDFDDYAFRKYMNKKGAAYRNQAIGLIRISLSFSRLAEQSFTQDAELSKVLQICDETLLRAATVPTGKHPTFKHHFQRAIRKWQDYDTKFHQSNCTEEVKRSMNMEKEKDENEPSKQYEYEDRSSKVIEFRIMRNLADPQPTVLRQVLNDDTKREEVLWNFIRFDEEKRLTLSQNAHFYTHLPTSPIPNSGSFRTTAILEHWHAYHPEPISVLTNTPGRVFLEIDRPPRAFDNVSDMNGTLIFKSICGELWSGDMVKESILQGDLYSSFHAEPLCSPSQPRVGATVNPANSGTPPTNSPSCVPVNDLNVALRQTLHPLNLKILIKRCSGCTNPPVVADTPTNAVSRTLNNARAGRRIFLVLFSIVVIVVLLL